MACHSLATRVLAMTSPDSDPLDNHVRAMPQRQGGHKDRDYIAEMKASVHAKVEAMRSGKSWEKAVRAKQSWPKLGVVHGGIPRL